MRRPLVTCLLTLLLTVFALPDRIASASAAARSPHATAQARKPGKKKKAGRPMKIKAGKPKPDKKKNDRGFEL
jgi:hypothetical protein